MTNLNSSEIDQYAELRALFARAGVPPLSESDMRYFQGVLENLKKPLKLPAGFNPCTPPPQSWPNDDLTIDD